VRNKGGAVSPGTERAQGVAIGDLGDRPEWTPYGEGGLETVEDWECGEDCPVRALGEQSGRSRSRVGSPRRSGEPGRGYGMTATGAEYDDEGTADRFFHRFPCDPFLYCPKAPTSERSIGCEDLPAKRAAKFASGEGPQGRTRVDGEWVNTETPRRDRPNHHPTVKPVALMRHLVRLVAPRRSLVIDPFTGSGTTGVAALAEEMRFAGAEREADYAEIARARLARAATEHPIAPLRTLPRR
jgi:site-specific DNA-methyltransferase (adenine-specific)